MNALICLGVVRTEGTEQIAMDRSENDNLIEEIGLIMRQFRVWEKTSGFPQCKYQVKLPRHGTGG
jgi:hypothetical protein